jgi:hypothetical protein
MMTKSPYFWPSALSPSVTWPPQSDIDNGWAGAGGIGSGASGSLPVGDTSMVSGSTVFVGGQNVVFRAQADWGDRTPTDVGFVAQSVLDTSVFAAANPGSPPTLDLKVAVANPLAPVVLPVAVAPITIDLQETKIIDSSGGTPKISTLSSVFKKVTDDGKLVIDGASLIATSDTPDGAPFDYKYDEDGKVLGAGTAFLKD